ncbi:MAG: YggS family pyridoxal phosphate-dependent enzyme [Cyclobacteriaceae bacterium]|nr:YggS family pyridoxal phosphate-dependent enzyme [Cyclobacteriaceae bacterium]MDH4296628.1 YggS family pyridoxal phosphate-dependent enzyme [Cyclobacteriaceae bacterium]MDH5247640.1 YggS family pyridoxal phosphate-dependent enzyme [Cyclobacteriaceae bacterium]
MNIKNSITKFSQNLPPGCKLVAVSKTKPIERILEAYQANQRIFGENKVQELVAKYEALPKDIDWHMIGHLQSNKVKYIASFVSLIHSVDSMKLLQEINKQAIKANRSIPCLLQVHIAEEETKFGFSEEEVFSLLHDENFKKLQNIKIIGLMGMATLTQDSNQIRREFKSLKSLFEKIKLLTIPSTVEMKELSIGMSGDYKIAIEEGSTMVRIGSAIFGARNEQ